MEQKNQSIENNANEAQANPIPEKYTADRFKLRYTDIHTSGCVYIHELVDRSMDDFAAVEEIAIDKAKLGCIVKILPVLEGNDPLREILYAGAKENKCPDLNIDGEYYEVKTPTLPLKRNKLSTCVKNGKEQAHNVIIRMLEKFHEKWFGGCG
ncbi:MAG: hypothetical protein IPP96_05075 [Chitinophagaceae bacterium]|nr:hypothetical protein [Chitinophagaceae bacterium]